MGQFLGYQSYNLTTICGHCGEEGPREDMEDHFLYCQARKEEVREEMEEESLEEKMDEDGS